jgi:hypothetical protein
MGKSIAKFSRNECYEADCEKPSDREHNQNNTSKDIFHHGYILTEVGGKLNQIKPQH